MSEAVKVIVRCRPMNQRERDLKCKEATKIDGKIAQCSIVHPKDRKNVKTFTFDGAFGNFSTTEQIYADIAYPLVEGVTEGYNGTIFAYGQTGCGKSFSMQGITDPPTQRGIIPRAFNHIFETIQVTAHSKYLVHASYIEIYNEEVRDLLGPDIKKRLELKEHPDKGVYVQSLSMHPCKNVRDCERVMEKGWKNRSVGSTLMNADSSRSHSIFTIHLERADTNDDGEEHIRVAKLNLVDLAGSERQAKTGSTGDRLKEATKINLSLSALGNVISALVDGRSKHIPYRDSKLTRLLQDSLGGNTKTLMVACLSPADNNYDESLSTLRYANRAKNIKNKPKINEDPKDALLREYHEEITRLRAMLRGEIPNDVQGSQKAQPQKVVEKIVHVKNEEEIEAAKQRIRQEYQNEIDRMREENEKMKISTEKAQEEMAKIHEHYNLEMARVDGDLNIPSPGEERLELHSVTSIDEPGMAPQASHMPASKTIDDKSPIAPDTEQLHPEIRNSADARKRESVVEWESNSSPVDSSEAAKQRLHMMEQSLVGGEQADNETVKERRRQKREHADQKQKQLEEALAARDGEDIILDVYESIQDEVKAKATLLEKEAEKNEVLGQEIKDLQTEFECDRDDYLDTIRKNERQIQYLEAVLERIHPCLRKDSNYANLDRIRAQSEFDEDKQLWILPKMTIEKTKLPPAAGTSGMRQDSGYGRRQNRDSPTNRTISDELGYEDRYLQKLNQSAEQNIANNYFKSKRAEQLLNKSSIGTKTSSPPTSSLAMNGTSSQLVAAPWQNDPLNMEQMRAAQVHGQISGDEFPVRKPMRLDSLNPLSAKSKKKKNKYY